MEGNWAVFAMSTDDSLQTVERRHDHQARQRCNRNGRRPRTRGGVISGRDGSRRAAHEGSRHQSLVHPHVMSRYDRDQKPWDLADKQFVWGFVVVFAMIIVYVLATR